MYTVSDKKSKPLDIVHLPRTPLRELTTLPRPSSRLGREIPPPHSLSLRRLRRLTLSWGDLLQGLRRDRRPWFM